MRGSLMACLLALSAVVGNGAAAAEEPAAAAQTCPDEPVPRITVVADIAETVYAHALTMTDLGSLQSRSRATPGHDIKQMLGLTRQNPTLGGNTTQGRYVTMPEGSFCIGYTDGTIRLGMTTTIFIVRELPPESCLYGQVLAHEERHAKVGRRLFTEFAATVERAIAEALAKTPYVPVAELGQAKQVAAQRLQEIIDPLFRTFLSTYRKRQAIIDASGEYARVRETCPGEQEKVVQGQQ